MATIVIIGAGFAGMATARALVRRGDDRVLVLEREPAPGQHASGRNAGMIRTLLMDPWEQDLAIASAKEIARIGGGDAFERTGGLVLADGLHRIVLREAAERSREAGREVLELDHPPDDIAPWLPGSAFVRGWLTPDDGVADISALLALYQEEATAGGAEIRTGVEVDEIVVKDGRATGVATDAGTIEADVVVNAAGAWAGQLGEVGAAETIGLTARRRHLFSTGPVDGADPHLPFVWHDTAFWYCRPESGGFLMSCCDETTQEPGEAVVDPAADEWLAEKLVLRNPALADLPVRRRWAGQRSFSRDDLFVVGWDPVRPGLYWVAGLDGHGVTVSAAVGDLAAREITSGEHARNPLSPYRF
ncbi:MAG: FAD-dependent oxidoreductase [Planctomycetota bacterium]